MIRKKGFTLIELLVVIAIIALLLAILMPALRKAKDIAKNVVCRTNIRTLVMGFRMYAETNDQKTYPHKAGASQGIQDLWLRNLEDLIKVDEVRFCPATKKNPQRPPFSWNKIDNPCMGTSKLTWIWPYGCLDSSGNKIPHGSVGPDQAEYGSYGFNWWLYSDVVINKNAAKPVKPWNSLNVPSSATVPVYADSKWVDFIAENGQTCPKGYDLDAGYSEGSSILCLVRNRHKDKINMGFVDGHVEPVKLENIWSFKYGIDFDTLGPQVRVGGDPIYQRD